MLIDEKETQGGKRSGNIKEKKKKKIKKKKKSKEYKHQ